MDYLVFTVYYVGHGDSTLIQFPGGKRFGMIDCCRPSWLSTPPIAKPLKSESRKRGKCDLAFVCVSHPHADHVRGLSNLNKIRNLHIQEYWHSLPDIEDFLIQYTEPPVNKRNPVWTAAARAYYEYQTQEFTSFSRAFMDSVGKDKVRQLQGLSILPSIDGVQIYCVSPVQEFSGPYKKAVMDSGGQFDKLDRDMLDSISVALLFVYGDNALLYASDMQSQQWLHIMPLLRSSEDISRHFPVSAMKASHHGGTRSFYDSLWNDVLGADKGSVIVSGGSRTHPSATFIESVSKARKSLFCTGKGGGGRIREKARFKRSFIQNAG